MVKNMERPGMILFDYGETLIREAAIDLLRGERAVFQYVEENPRHITPEEAAAFKTFAEAFQEQVNHALGVNKKGRPEK